MNRIGRILIAVALALPAGTFAATSFSEKSSSKWLAAAECERRGDWYRAIALYRQAWVEDGRDSQIRIAIARCMRRAEQVDRLNDPIYREYADGLTFSQALAIYAEVLTKLPELYWNREQARLEQLHRQALDELSHAVREPALESLISAAKSQSALDVPEAVSAIRGIAMAGKQFGISPGVIVLESAAGACAGLDEYTRLLNPWRDEELAELGITLRIKDHHLFIDRIRPDTWAADTGLLPGDRIKRNPDSDEQIELEVQSSGEPPKLLRVPTIPAIVDVGLPRENVGYIQIAHFGRSLIVELDSALLRLRSAGARVIVLDLRGNPGGVLQSAVQAAERFLPKGTIVTARGQAGAHKSFSTTGPAACELPLVILINEQTASAAEAFAAALKDNNRATLVGEITYGKAAVQQTVALDAGGGMRFTLARLFAPSGTSFHGVGVAPHLAESRPDRILETGLEQAAKLAAGR